MLTFFSVMGIQSKALPMLGKCRIASLHPQPQVMTSTSHKEVSASSDSPKSEEICLFFRRSVKYISSLEAISFYILKSGIVRVNAHTCMCMYMICARTCVQSKVDNSDF